MSAPNLVSVLLAAGLGASVFAQEAQVVEASFKLADAKAPVSPLSRSATLTSTAPAGTTIPASLHDALCGTCTIGKKNVAVAVGNSEAGKTDGPDTLYIDLNGNGKLEDDEKSTISVTSQSRGTMTMTRSEPIDVELNFGTGPIAAKAVMSKVNDKATVAMSFPGFLSATCKLGDTEFPIAVLDGDFDGAMGTAGDLWLVGRADGKPQQPYALMAMSEHCYEDGNLVSIKVNGNKVAVTAKKADAPIEKDLEGQRERAAQIWTERFNAEREGFVKDRKLDTSRKLATTPINWHYVTFAEAEELAKQAKKPMFVDVMAFWCVWCYRMDYYTYPDGEVAKFMNDNFVPVKIIQEQDRVGDYDAVMKGKLEAKGIPAMGIFDAEGNLLHSIGGWKSPQDFMKDLESGKDKAKK